VLADSEDAEPSIELPAMGKQQKVVETAGLAAFGLAGSFWFVNGRGGRRELLS
jgi:hypothetical protein